MNVVGAHETVKLGQAGGQVISNTAAFTNTEPGWAVIQVVTAAVLSALTAEELTNSVGLVGITLPANCILKGRFTAITLASGVVVAYNAA